MNKRFLYTLLFLIIIVVSCKKYGDNAKFTLRTPMNRITGTWQITKYEVDGIDSLPYFTFYGNDVFVITKERYYKTSSYKVYINKTSNYFDWTLGQKKSVFVSPYPFGSIDKYIDTIVNLDTVFLPGELRSDNNEEWVIEELTNNKFVITQKYNNWVLGDSSYISYSQVRRIACKKIGK